MADVCCRIGAGVAFYGQETVVTDPFECREVMREIDAPFAGRRLREIIGYIQLLGPASCKAVIDLPGILLFEHNSIFEVRMNDIVLIFI